MAARTITAETGSWRATIVEGSAGCTFDPRGWLEAIDPASDGPAPEVTATVEAWRAGSGILPWALISGTYVPGSNATLRIDVGHSGALPRAPQHDCRGPMGRLLARGLPEPFAGWAFTMLRNQELIRNRPGRISVHAAAYHEADSGRLVFSLAALVLKWALVEGSSIDISDDIFGSMYALAKKRSASQ